MERDVNSYFDGIISNIDTILNNDFYKNKKQLNIVKTEIIKWYDSYKEYKTLKKISPKTLEDLDLEITDFFAQYIETESVEENYAERLLYDFDELERYWKAEMLGENYNGR